MEQDGICRPKELLDASFSSLDAGILLICSRDYLRTMALARKHHLDAWRVESFGIYICTLVLFHKLRSYGRHLEWPDIDCPSMVACGGRAVLSILASTSVAIDKSSASDLLHRMDVVWCDTDIFYVARERYRTK